MCFVISTSSEVGAGALDGLIMRQQGSKGILGLQPRPIERRLDWVFYKTEMKIWAVWAVRAVRKKKWI